MNIHSPRPERSPEAIAERRWSNANSKALIMHQGYEHDPVLEDICERWVIGELTMDEYRNEVLQHCQELADKANGN